MTLNIKIKIQKTIKLMGAVIRFLPKNNFSILKSIIVLLRHYSKTALQTKSHEHNYETQSKN